ncbi:MAG TPA: hypothetical protein VIG24_14360 [Acidimicrobiia bacterium]
MAHLVSPLTLQRPDDAAHVVLVLDEWLKCTFVLRPCERCPRLAEMRDRTYAIDH